MHSPMIGEVIPLKKVNNSVFSSELLGKGIAIIPSEGVLYAPFDGFVTKQYATSHAFGIMSYEGVELLIHIGTETVNLEGRHFSPQVKTGNSFKKNDVLCYFDIRGISEEGYELVTPIIVTNSHLFDITILESESIQSVRDYILLIKERK